MNKTFANAGPALKKVRKEAKLTQRNMADYFGVDKSLISRFESGERTLSVGEIEQMATLLGVDVVALLDDKIGVKHLSIASKTARMSTEDLHAIAAINKIALNSDLMTRLLKESKHSEGAEVVD
jgi:transcriptional regulator with XRE-family HTH domain